MDLPSTSLKCVTFQVSGLNIKEPGNLVSKSQILVKSHSQSLGQCRVHEHKFNMTVVLLPWVLLTHSLVFVYCLLLSETIYR